MVHDLLYFPDSLALKSKNYDSNELTLNLGMKQSCWVQLTKDQLQCQWSCANICICILVLHFALHN